jgi:hypothetical protein
MGIDINRLIWFADRHASGKKVLLFLVLQLAMGGLMLGVVNRFSLLAHGMLPLDVKFFYGTEAALQFFAAIPAEAAQFYLQVLSPLDLVFPALYSFSFALIVVWLLKKVAQRGLLFPQWLVLYPFAIALIDYLENIGIVLMIHLNPALPQALVLATSVFSSLKWLGAFVGMGILAYLLYKMATTRADRFGRLT